VLARNLAVELLDDNELRVRVWRAHPCYRGKGPHWDNGNIEAAK